MAIFDGLLKNESVQKMAFGHLRSIFKDGKVKAIVISTDDAGETVIDVYNSEITVNEIDDLTNAVTQRTYGNGTPHEITIPIPADSRVPVSVIAPAAEEWTNDLITKTEEPCKD